MALATTCPQCQTRFKVVPDQLKLRRGLVRCGVCQHVFSGIDNLRYVNEARPAPPRPAVAPPAESIPDELRTAFFLPDTVIGDARERARQPSRSRPAASLPTSGDAATADATPASPADPSADVTFDRSIDSTDAAPTDTAFAPSHDPAAYAPDAASSMSTSTPSTGSTAEREDLAEPVRPRRSRRRPTSLVGDDLPHGDASLAAEAIVTGHALETGPIGPDDIAIIDDDDELFGGAFAAQTRRRPSTRARRRARIAIGALGVLLLVQLALGSRDLLAARVPAMRPLLETIGAPLGLQVELPRMPSEVTIESFELAGSGQPGIYKLNALLRNRASHPVRWPAIELTLTDTFGGVLSSKVLLPDQFLPGERPADGFAGGTEKTVALDIAIHEVVPSGYRAILFYP